MPTARHLRLSLESLEGRQLLTAAPAPFSFATSDLAAEVAPADATPSQDSDVLPGTIVLYRHGSEFATFEPAADTDIDRGLALRAALAAALPGDEVQLQAAVYDIGSSEHLDFPAHVTLRGAGQEVTRISSGCALNNDPENPYTLHNESVLEDLWLEGRVNDGQYQPLVGMGGDPGENVDTYLHRVKITGDSDGLYLWTGNTYQYTIWGYDIEISTKYDAIAVLGSGLNGQTVKLFNSTINVAQPSAILAHSSNAVNAHSGFVGLYNCTVTVTGDATSVQTAGIWAWNQGTVEIVNTTFDVTAPTGLVYDLYIQNDRPVTVVSGAGSGPGGTYTSSTNGEQYAAFQDSQLTARQVFYNDSAFDDTTPHTGLVDAGSIAPDKTAYLPDDGLAQYANITNYARGLNGLMIDLVGMHGTISAADFVFKIGTDNTPEDWVDAPAPLYVTNWGGQGAAASDRVEIVWADGAIANTWLQVQMLPTANTGLAAVQTFYFGNLIGDIGNPSATAFTTTITYDAAGVIDAGPGPATGIDDVHDIDRSNTITVTGDRSAVIANVGALRRLNLSGEGDSLPADAGVLVAETDEPSVQAFAWPELRQVLADMPAAAIDALLGALSPPARAAAPGAAPENWTDAALWPALARRSAKVDDAALLDFLAHDWAAGLRSDA
ncbi:MAG: hypothetical protein AB7O59_05655 [Pirellulales bacterium]